MFTATRYKLFYNFFSLGTVQAISSLIQLVVIPHVIRRVGVDGYGVIAVAQVMMFYLAGITDYSFNQTATRDIAVNRDDRAHVSRIFSTVFCTRLLLCLFAFVLFMILVAVIPFFREQLFLYCMAFTFVIGQSILVNWFFMGMERMHVITYVTLVARVLFAVLVFVFIRDKGDGYLFLFFLGLGNIVAGLISLAIAVHKYGVRLALPAGAAIVTEWKEGWQITLSHISNSTCNYANIFILRLFANDLVVGYYGIAERIFFTIKQVFGVFSQAIYPRLCQVLQAGKQQAISFLKQVYTGFFLLVVLGALLLFIFSPEVLYFFMGNEFPNAVFFLRMFCIIAVIVCLNIPGTLLLLAANQKQNYLKVYAAAAILNLSLNLVLANYYLATGTVIAIFITEFFISIGVTRFVSRIGQVGQKQMRGGPAGVWDIDKQNI